MIGQCLQLVEPCLGGVDGFLLRRLRVELVALVVGMADDLLQIVRK